MGRNKKIGLDYFPFDTDFFQDIKIRKLIKYQRGKAVTVYTLLLCFIYKQGYYMLWDEELPFIISEQTGFEEAYIHEVIRCCLALGLFSKELYDEEKVLTSKGIQERYLKICKDCHRICEFSEYNLISSEEKGVSSEKTPKNSVESTQRKEKKNKEDNIKEYPPSLPPQAGGKLDEGNSIILSQILNDGTQRNFEGLVKIMQRLSISQAQQDEIMKLSNFGQIGHEVWKLLIDCEASLGKSKFDKSRIKMPGLFILSKLKK